jgi:hypothetical protein
MKDPLDLYNVTWEISGQWGSPRMQSKLGLQGDASMPLGNGDIGCNVWVEPNKDLLFTIGKTDSWSENGRLLKLGRVRVSFSPNPFYHGDAWNFRPFRQELKLRQGELEITAGEVVLTAQDPDLPRSLVIDSDAQPKFKKYVGGDFHIYDYPYPYVVGRLSWQFPVILPHDPSGHRVNRHYYDVLTLRDLKAALEAVLIKQGTFTMLFHPHGRPHGWMRNEVLVKLIDYVDRKHDGKVKFLTFREAQQRIDKHLLAGQPLRAANGQDNGVRLLDLDADGLLDVVIGNEQVQRTRLWRPRRQEWVEGEFPVRLVEADAEGNRREAGVRFGVLGDDAHASLLVRNEETAGVWHFNGQKWIKDANGLRGLEIDGQPIFTSQKGRDLGVRLRDLDGDGRCELLVGNPAQQAVFGWSAEQRRWRRLPFTLPWGTMLVDTQGRDAGLRFADLNQDGYDDLVFSDEERYSVHVFVSKEQGWRQVRAGKQGEPDAVPAIVLDGTNNGAWFQSRHMWVANEDTLRTRSHLRNCSRVPRKACLSLALRKDTSVVYLARET